MVTDAISWLDCNPMIYLTSKCNHAMLGMSSKGDTIAKWNSFSKLWHCYNEYNTGMQMQKCNLNQVFTNHSKEENFFLLLHKRLLRTKKANDKLKHFSKHNAILDKELEVSLVDDTHLVCKDGRMIIPKPLQRCTVLWFHHYLQHPGHTCLEETMKSTMYWKGIHTSI